MVIHNFYMAVWYSLWFYVLCCVFAKLYLDKFRQQRIEKKKKSITEFFISYRGKKDEKREKHILKLMRTDELFEHTCECYINSFQQYSVKRKKAMKAYMGRLLRYKMKHLKEEDVQMRCLILSYMHEMDIDFGENDWFITACSNKSKLEQLWAEAIYSGENTVKVESKVG